MTGTIDHMRSTHDVSPVMSDAVHAHAHATAAMITVKASGDMERPYRETIVRRDPLRCALRLAASLKNRNRVTEEDQSLAIKPDFTLTKKDGHDRPLLVGIRFGEALLARVGQEG